MGDEAQTVDTQTVHVSMGKDRSFKLSGQLSFLTALVIILMGVVWYLIHFNLKSWGEPVDLRETFQIHANKVDEQTMKMSYQHSDIMLAMRWNTYVLRYCSGNDQSRDSKDKCAKIDLDRPEAEESTRRRYRTRPEVD